MSYDWQVIRSLDAYNTTTAPLKLSDFEQIQNVYTSVGCTGNCSLMPRAVELNQNITNSNRFCLVKLIEWANIYIPLIFIDFFFNEHHVSVDEIKGDMK